MDFPITLHIPEFRPVRGTPQGIATTLVDNMSGSIENILTTDDEPIQFDPAPIRVNNVTVDATPANDRLQSIQDKDGEIALLDDAYGIRPTVILPEGLVSVDWDIANDFKCVLSGNRESVFYMFHSQAGQEINILVVNQGTNQLVDTWDTLIQWPSSTPPVMPPSTPGGYAMQKVNLVNVNGIIYGEFFNYTV